jgi:hypothetical protein
VGGVGEGGALPVDGPAERRKEFIKFNNVVDVAFKLLIDKIEFVDKLFKLLNIVLDVVFTFDIKVPFKEFEFDNDDNDNIVDVEK